ncbi:MAG TPA: hypothetical protein VHZ04_00790 [Candidatus Paceibacterota bacterium]|nr:hypothetical protein [Candidatus Paceibacterota bacterium]
MTNIHSLFVTLADYPYDLFDPYRYGTVKRPRWSESDITKARKRIKMYVSPFKGYSMYEVDGVFFGRSGKEYEERTQVIRLMFRFKSGYASVARKRHCSDVLRSILFFVMHERGHIAGEAPWDASTKERFMTTHEPWSSPAKRKFAKRYFPRIAAEVRKWIDDCGLFTFGYLVRELSDKVLEVKRPEEEIWVATFFDLLLNVVKHSKPKKLQRVKIK